jgi:hypothetical protein
VGIHPQTGESLTNGKHPAGPDVFAGLRILGRYVRDEIMTMKHIGSNVHSRSLSSSPQIKY